jgi:hypothetical protein
MDPEDEPSAEEWDYLMFDVDATCYVCGQPIHAYQAVGHIGNSVVHAKCYRAPRRE